MARGEPPGCWVSPELLAPARQEAAAKDGGLQARLERAARTVAVLRGLGYAGAYLGGTHDADQITWIIRRARELAPRVGGAGRRARLRGGRAVLPLRPARQPRGGPDAGPRPGALPGKPPRGAAGRRSRWRPIARCSTGSVGVFPVTRDTGSPPSAHSCVRVGGSPNAGRRARRARGARDQEAALRVPGVRQLRAGPPRVRVPSDLPEAASQRPVRPAPIRGAARSPEKPCIWVAVYDRAKAAERARRSRPTCRPLIARLRDTSSWINYFLDRDAGPRRDA